MDFCIIVASAPFLVGLWDGFVLFSPYMITQSFDIVKFHLSNTSIIC